MRFLLQPDSEILHPHDLISNHMMVETSTQIFNYTNLQSINGAFSIITLLMQISLLPSYTEERDQKLCWRIYVINGRNDYVHMFWSQEDEMHVRLCH